MCLHTGLYTGGLFHLLGFSAVIKDLIGVLYNCLVTAAAKCHINGSSCIIIILCITFTVHTNTDT